MRDDRPVGNAGERAATCRAVLATIPHEPIFQWAAYYSVAALIPRRSPVLLPWRVSAMRTPVFGLSTTPVMDIKSELRLLLEREMLALVYRTPR